MIKIIKEGLLSDRFFTVGEIKYFIKKLTEFADEMRKSGIREVPASSSLDDMKGVFIGVPGNGFLDITRKDQYFYGEDDGQYSESLEESFEDRSSIEDGANQMLSDIFDKLGVDPQAASRFSRWDEVVNWISSVVMQLKDIKEESLKESDEVIKNYTVEYTHGDGDRNDVDIKATSFGDLMDKFWSGEYGNSDEIEILSIYDEDGTEYDLGTGEEIW